MVQAQAVRVDLVGQDNAGGLADTRAPIIQTENHFETAELEIDVFLLIYRENHASFDVILYGAHGWAGGGTELRGQANGDRRSDLRARDGELFRILALDALAKDQVITDAF
jgi:hypothetical protein